MIERKRHKTVFDKTNGVCYLCHEPLDFNTFTIDHVIPISKGGTRTLDNEMPAHEDCNLAKGNSIIRDNDHFIKLKNKFIGRHRWNKTMGLVMKIVENKIKLNHVGARKNQS